MDMGGSLAPMLVNATPGLAHQCDPETNAVHAVQVRSEESMASEQEVTRLGCVLPRVGTLDIGSIPRSCALAR